MDNIRKLVKKTFRDVGIKFEIKTNLKTVNFLGVTFYNPYKKPSDKILYIKPYQTTHPRRIKHLLTLNQ